MKWLYSLLVLMGCCLQALPATNVPPLIYQFRDPKPRQYEVRIGLGENIPSSTHSAWILARPLDDPAKPVEVGRRVILSPVAGANLNALLQARPLKNPRQIHPGIWVLEAPDAWIALEQAQSLSRLPEVAACHPVTRGFLRVQGTGGYAPAPNDPYFPKQWHLENRSGTGVRQGIDVNVRSAWSVTRGAGTMASVVDDGVQMDHPDLVERFLSSPNFNFADGTSNAGPSTPIALHSTAVAGLIGATAGNQRGVSGVAPEAGLASWVIFQGSLLAADAVAMKDMFEAFPGRVDIQNHSWGAGGTGLYPLPPLEDIGISNAVTLGRNGLGVVVVRAASNFRYNPNLGDANADGYASDPRVITVAAVRSDGRAARYSNPGSCVLVAAPSAETQASGTAIDTSYPTLATTDLTGFNGRNASGAGDAPDYRFDSTGFNGTSGATPIVSGVVALILSANPALGYRDVQQILAVSSQLRDAGDPMLQTNGAGLKVSYNQGFGVPNAGLAVKRALQWTPRPPLQQVTLPFDGGMAIPDDGMRVEVSGLNIPESLASIPVSPGLGAHADDGTSPFPVTAVGTALSAVTTAISGRAVLVQRGINTFTEKLQNVTQPTNAARLAIVYDNTGTTERMVMANTDFTPIPAVFMARTAGQTLEQCVATNPTVTVRLATLKAVVSATVTQAWVCEHVGVRVQTTHARRGDLRITLVSPAGTRSILQKVNSESVAGPTDWTYFSVQHFLESSAGTWKLEIIDEEPFNTGSLLKADLILRGVAISDVDRDGLDDAWETRWFGNLGRTASEDPDGDGIPTSVEQLLRTDPTREDVPFETDLSLWNPDRLRLSWPGTPGRQYQILASTNPEGPYLPIATVKGEFPVTEWLAPVSRAPAGAQVFRVQRLQP